jgi:hypothetical protein
MLSNFEQFLSINCKAGYVFVMLYVLLKVNISQVSPAILGERIRIRIGKVKKLLPKYTVKRDVKGSLAAFAWIAEFTNLAIY